MKAPALPTDNFLREVIATIQRESELTPEAARLLENCKTTPLSVNASNTGHPLAWVHFIQWMSMCSESGEFRAQFDRLRGTNISLRGSPMDLAIDSATGKFEADARAFFDFCRDLYLRLPSA